MMYKALGLLVLSVCLLVNQSANAALQIGGQPVEFEQVAVMVYAKTADAKKMQRSAQTRIENILLDNGITVLDQDKADDLKMSGSALKIPVTSLLQKIL